MFSLETDPRRHELTRKNKYHEYPRQFNIGELYRFR